ncbi:hypothetical protein AB6A40_003687 [Gnathostoma spinigerum]|uniref:Uncharacterized protein n=1 Tax=Gnathostoma spinigerum TaxID=75299 RepID=A0ABD6EJ26_9BILA
MAIDEKKCKIMLDKSVRMVEYGGWPVDEDDGLTFCKRALIFIIHIHQCLSQIQIIGSNIFRYLPFYNI